MMLPTDNLYAGEEIEATFPQQGLDLSRTSLKKQNLGTEAEGIKIRAPPAPQYMSLLFAPPQHVKEPYLPIKKRRLKESQSADVLEAEASHPTANITTTAMHADNSREWWRHANQSWSRNTTHRPSQASQPVVPKKDLRQTQPKPQNREGRVSNIQLLQKQNLDKDDPRSAEFQVWFDQYYPISSVPPSSNKLLDKLKLVDPEILGGKYPPWVSLEEVRKWDISLCRPSRRIPDPVVPTPTNGLIRSLATREPWVESGRNVRDDNGVDSLHPTGRMAI